MATTYAELQTEIADFLNRDDLTAVIPTFIKLSEAGFNRDLRHWRMEKRQSATATEQYLTKPDDWLETIRLHVASEATSGLHLVSRDDMMQQRAAASNTAGTPCYYCHSGNTFELYPTPTESTELELLYYGSIPALSDANTSNWLLDYAPDLYLYGALLQSAGYLHEDTRVQMWSQVYSLILQQLNAESDFAKYSGSGLKVKNRGIG